MNSSPIRLIALDLDGTLLDDRKQISRRSLRALRAAADQGVLLVPATGRTVAGIPAELLALPGVRYAITANGARVMDLAENRALSEDYIPRDLALQVYDLLTQYECLVDLFQDGQGYTTEANAAQADRYVPENLRAYVLNSRVRLPDLRAFIAQQERGLEKLTLFFLSEDQRQKAWAKVAALGLEVVSSLPLNMEISAAGVTKGSGLRALAGALDLPAEALMACGDGGNDIPMITAAGLGVAMGNAFPEVKAAADFITRTNNEDGVAYAIHKFVLGDDPDADPRCDIRMVALDLDGTLLNHDSQITPRTMEAIADAIRRGIVVLPATGRGLSSLPVAIHPMPGLRYALTSNGAAVWDLGEKPVDAIFSRYGDPGDHPTAEPKRLLYTPLPADTARTVFQILSSFEGELSIFARGQTLKSEEGMRRTMERMNDFRSTEAKQKNDGRFVILPELAPWMEDHAADVEKFCMFFDTVDQAQEALKALEPVEGIELTQGSPENVEVTAAGVNKGTALLALGRALGIQREQILAIGDSENDRAMLREAGVAAVMANAMPSIRSLADLVSRQDCDHDGVAELFERLSV